MTTDNAGSLVPDDQPRGLSARGLKTALQMAARERLSADELSLGRVTHPCLKTVSDEAVRLAALADFIARETAAAAGNCSPARVDPEADFAAQGLDDLEWIQDRHQEYLDLADSIDRLVNSELQVAFGRPGEPGDVGLIVDVAAKVAQVYCRFLAIRSAAQTRPTAPLLAEVMLEFSRVCDSSIAEFQDYPTRSLRTLEEALAADDGQTELVLRFDMALTADTDRFHAALDRAHQWVFGGPLG